MKKFLSLVLALVMTMSLVTVSAGAKDFTDNGSITYKEAVEVMSAVGVIDGYTDGSFQPTTNLTRGAAAKIICNLILGPTTAAALGADTAPYSDVPTNNTFAGYIAYCQKEKIISGYADGTFRPSAPLTGYAFMKMLLGALGYDSAKEGYTGANWSVNVAKQAIAIGLADGNDDFVGQASVNREEAMLYAFNTMQATMVEYGNETTVTVGDITVETSGKATEVSQGAYDNNMLKPYLQFAEKYFPNLKLSKGTDDFARPANIWYFKGDKVGTYAKTPAVSYSDNVELGDIYRDLQMSVKDTAEVYVNGEEQDSVLVSKANEYKIADKDAKQNEGLVSVGSTVEVFYVEDNNDVTICVIDTYAGTISKTVEAKGNKDRYVVVADEGGMIANFNNEFTTEEEFDDDTVVLFTYSKTAKAIKSVVAAESVEGTLTKKVIDKSFTLGETTYKHAKNMAYDSLSFDAMTTKSDYTFYLDSYGNVIYVVEEEFVPEDFALVLMMGTGFDSSRVKLLTGSGAVKTYYTDKDYTTKGIDEGDIVTFKVDEDGQAALRSVKGEINGTAENNGAGEFSMKSGEAKITYDTNKALYANSKTVFVTYNDNTKDYKVYTGINSAPTITPKNAETVKFDAYCRTDGLATVMFIDITNTTSVFDSKNVIFLAGESQSKATYDNDGVYYTYNAVVNDEIVEGFKVDANVALTGANGVVYGKNFMANGASYDDSIVVGFSDFANADDTKTYTGTVKLSGDYTIGFKSGNSVVRYTVADNANIYKIDAKGNISEATLNSIKTDDDDQAMIVLKDGQISNLFVQEKTDGSGETPDVKPEDNLTLTGSTFTYTYAETVPTIIDVRNAVMNYVADKMTDSKLDSLVSNGDGSYTAVISSIQFKVEVVAAAK